MLSPIDAYNVFMKKFPDTLTETIFDWGDFYTCGRCHDGDMVDDEWKIDKETGKITEIDLLDHIHELKLHNDEDVTEHHVKILLRKKI